jgi:dsRNA-specific ribonuclease
LQQQACDANLASVARDIGLARHLALHPGHIGPVSTKILATGMEAIFGAIYEDCGGDMSIVTAAMTAVGIDVAMIDDY